MNKSHISLVEIISKINNENRGISDEDVGDGDHGIGKLNIGLLYNN